MLLQPELILSMQIPLQNAYMSEKVEMSSLVSDKSVRNMMDEMENIYATQFGKNKAVLRGAVLTSNPARGDKKRARTKLRGGFLTKSHHFSTFRSGILLGLGIPALVSGTYQSMPWL